ncbi:hypothetical protein C8Q80DRAFT_587448 [Daedaleopsis nitida]|nr:hypothetical protein C8Q80DRAFT_587448 [Daedaleopsis nitida]
MKAVVGTLFFLDTVTTGLMAAALYNYAVTNFDGPLETFSSITQTISVGYGLHIIIGSIAQCFFVQRLWYLSHNKLVVTALDSPVVNFPTGFAGIMSAVCDISIVVALCYYLQSGRSGFAKTDSLVDRLMMYAIQRGALTAICQTFYVIFALVYHARLVFLPFSLVLGKLYCNTVLATLNVRKSLKDFDHSEEAMEPGSLVIAPPPGRRNARAESTDLSTLEVNFASNQQHTSGRGDNTSSLENV